MKKLLSLLSIPTLIASLPTPLLANITLTCGKRDIITSNSNNEHLPSTKISDIGGVLSITIDKINNVYFSTKNGAYVLKPGETIPTKINGAGDYVYFITPDKDNNLYVGTAGHGSYKLSAGSNTATKIDGIKSIIYSIVSDNKHYLYFGTNDGAYVIR